MKKLFTVIAFCLLALSAPASFSPGSSAGNLPNGRNAHAVHLCQFTKLRSTTTLQSNLSYLCPEKFVHPMLLSGLTESSGPSFHTGIPAIISPGAEPKVSRIDAASIRNISREVKSITIVKDAFAFGYLSEVDNPANAMAVYKRAFACFNHSSVALSGQSSPQPAGLGLVYFLNEAPDDAGRKTLRCKKLRRAKFGREIPSKNLFCNHKSVIAARICLQAVRAASDLKNGNPFVTKV